MMTCRATWDQEKTFCGIFLDEFNKEKRSSLLSTVIGKIKKYFDRKNVGCAVGKCNNVSVFWCGA
jgi:hypothetical protein